MNQIKIRSEILRFLKEKILRDQKLSFHRQDVAEFFENKVEEFSTARGSLDRKLILEELHRMTLEFLIVPGLSTNFYEAEPWYTISEKGILFLEEK